MELLRRRRRTVSTALALLLAVESVTAVSAAAGGVLAARQSAAHALPAASPAGAVMAEQGRADAASARDAAVVPGASPAPAAPQTPTAGTDARDDAVPRATGPTAPATTAAPSRTAAAHERKAPPRIPAKAAAPLAATAPASTKTAAFYGRNHVWIPALGINRSVSLFPCSRSAPPGNAVYRWGCAGANNVYLLGHAGGVFRPLHDAYVSGRLKVGMRVYYADGSGRVHVFAVRWWKVVRPTTDAAWAWAAQSVPSMTLQTCLGANSEYRLMVRLVQVG
jgi:sortase (surface protein transpeptidase)